MFAFGRFYNFSGVGQSFSANYLLNAFKIRPQIRVVLRKST